MAVVMIAIFDVFGNVIGMEPMEMNDQLQTLTTDGQVLTLDAASALDTGDLTTTGEIELTTTDTDVAAEDVGKGVVLGHSIHLDVKAVAADATVASEAVADTDWDGGEW